MTKVGGSKVVGKHAINKYAEYAQIPSASMDHCLEEVLQHVGHPDAGLSANGAENTGKVSIESPGVTQMVDHGSSSSGILVIQHRRILSHEK